MSYQPKPGDFSLFKNKKKEKETHPDYRGDGLDLDGRPVWVDAWLKKTDKGTFMSCRLKLKDTSRQPEKPKGGTKPQAEASDFDDDIPF